MKLDCDTKNPLLRDGVSQNERMLKALQPDFVKIDERSAADLLYFAQKYAANLQYYDTNNQKDGDWKAFFENDVSTVISLISKKDIDDYKKYFITTDSMLASATAFDAGAKESFTGLFDLLFTMIKEVNEWYENSVEGLSFRLELYRIITSQLKDQFYDLINYYNWAVKNNYLAAEETARLNNTPEWVEHASKVMKKSFGVVWIAQDSDESLSWEKYAEKIGASLSVSWETNADDLAKVKKIAGLLTPVFEVLFNTQKQLIRSAPKFLDESIQKWPKHEPHMALFLAFTQLFKYAQGSLNKITKRHLDFYYKKVLRFEEKDEVPDRVHLIFKLAKQANSHLLKSGTLLKAGKDETGKDVFYKTDKELAINKALVKELKSVFIDKNDNSRIYSASVADSKDGQGEKLDSDEPKWKTFGESQFDAATKKYKGEEDRTMQFAEIGLSVASSSLYLLEGTRTVTITLKTQNSLTEGSLTKQMFDVQFSGEKKWISAKIIAADTNNDILIDSDKIVIKVELDEAMDPVVAYDSNVLGGSYDTNLPMLKLELVNKSGIQSAYEELGDLVVTSVDLAVEVVGVKTLILQSDLGLLDGTKPFSPFGTLPSPGSNFYIGSAEVFQKDLTSLSLWFNWKDVPHDTLSTHYTKYTTNVTNESFTAEVAALAGKTWKVLAPATGAANLSTTGWIPSGSNTYCTLFDATKATNKHGVIATNFSQYTPGSITEELTELDNSTQRGFLRLQLKGPSFGFGHKEYRDIYTKTLIAYAKDPNDTTEGEIPKEPYTPLLETLTLDYKAQDTIDLTDKTNFENREAKLFHDYPFGTREIHEKIETPTYLFPQFFYNEDDSPKSIEDENEGELYIGITDLVPRQNLSLLFQVAEGSADPELTKQTVNWSFMDDNVWTPFESKEILSDTTNGLTTSGIITFDIPKSATDDNTLLTKDMHWLRASVHQDSAAVCDMISVQAQAVQASYVNSKNDPNFLNTSLPAETIEKLKNSEVEVKSVTQPYASFGGQIKEQSNQLYTRVSERLRHKRRCVTIWDYEREVLQNFPSIFKVKCINHGTYNYKTDSSDPTQFTINRSEFAPGFVTIVVIPDVNNKNAVNALEPKASIATLEEIRRHVIKVVSPFAAQTLRVINPLYERIELDFQVEFNTGLDRGIYADKLQNDIKQFLSPWAFGKGRDIVFGANMHKSVILNYVEERPYVDFVTEFKMHQPGYKNNIDEAVTTTARSIIVSGSSHKINEVKDSKCSISST